MPQALVRSCGCAFDGQAVPKPTQAGERLGRWVWWWRRAMAATTISLERSVAGCFLAVNEGLQRLVVTLAFGAQLAYQFLALVLLGFGDGLGA